MAMLVAACETTMVNCFKKAGICKESQESSIIDDDDPFKVLAEEVNILREKNPDLVPGDVTAEALVEADEDITTADGVVRTDHEVLADSKLICMKVVKISRKQKKKTTSLHYPLHRKISVKQSRSCASTVCFLSKGTI